MTQKNDPHNMVGVVGIGNKICSIPVISVPVKLFWLHFQALGWHSYTDSMSQLYKRDCLGKSLNFWVYVFFFVAAAVSLTVNFCVDPVHFLKSAMGNCIICSSKKPMNCFLPISLTWFHCKVASFTFAPAVINFVPSSTNNLSGTSCLMVNLSWQGYTWLLNIASI